MRKRTSRVFPLICPLSVLEERASVRLKYLESEGKTRAVRFAVQHTNGWGWMRNRGYTWILSASIFTLILLVDLSCVLVSTSACIARDFTPSGATIMVDPSRIEMDPITSIGDILHINVSIANITNLAGLEFKLSWNASLVNCTDITENLYATVTPPAYHDNIWKIRNQINNTEGFAYYAYTYQDLYMAQTDGYAPTNITASRYPEGKLTVAVLTFTVTKVPSPGTYYDGIFNFSRALAGDMSGTAIPVTPVNGYYRISGSSDSILAPTIFVDPPLLNFADVAVGTQFPLNVSIANITNLAGLEFKLSWNASLVNCTDITENLYATVTPPAYHDNIWKIRNQINNTEGSAHYAYTCMDLAAAQTNGYAPFNVTAAQYPRGKLAVAVLTFTVTETPPAGTCYEGTFEFPIVTAGDVNANRIPVTPVNGHYRISVGSELFQLPASPVDPLGNAVERAELTSISSARVINALPKEYISFTANFRIWQGSNPSELDQLLLIYSWTPSWPPTSDYYVTLHDGAIDSSDLSGSSQINFTAPSSAGTYYVWFVFYVSQSAAEAAASFIHRLSIPAHVKVIVNNTNAQDSVAYFVTTPQIVGKGRTVTFQAASSYSNGTIVAYSWSFGDGNSTTTTIPTVNYTYSTLYSTPGRSIVNLTVTCSDERVDSFAQEIEIFAPPRAYFSYSPTNPRVGDTVIFSASGSSSENGWQNQAYASWNFGDSSSALYETVYHEYQEPGNYSVYMTVTDSVGLTDSYSLTISVSPLPWTSYIPWPIVGVSVFGLLGFFGVATFIGRKVRGPRLIKKAEKKHKEARTLDAARDYAEAFRVTSKKDTETSKDLLARYFDLAEKEIVGAGLSGDKKTLDILAQTQKGLNKKRPIAKQVGYDLSKIDLLIVKARSEDTDFLARYASENPSIREEIDKILSGRPEVSLEEVAGTLGYSVAVTGKIVTKRLERGKMDFVLTSDKSRLISRKHLSMILHQELDRQPSS